MIRTLFFMLGLLSFSGISFDIQCVGLSFFAANNREKNEKKPVKPSEQQGLMKQAFCAAIAVPITLAQYVQSGFHDQEQQASVEPWFWSKWHKPAAIDVAACSAIPWYLHGAHGYYRRLKNLKNDELQQYSTTWQRAKALDFGSFSKWHPIQSMKGTRRMIPPLVGPMIAAHLTGFAYHAAVEYTPKNK